MLTDASVTSTYSYVDPASSKDDGRLRLVTKGTQQTAYGYDNNGNRTAVNGTNATYDDQDRLNPYGTLEVTS